MQQRFLGADAAPVTVIDVDAHFEPGDEWLLPYPDLAKRLPKLDPGALAVHAIVGDLLRDVPAAARPPFEQLVPPVSPSCTGRKKSSRRSVAPKFEGKNQFQVANAQAGLKWMDEQGIHIQNVICLAGIAYGVQVEDLGLRQEVIRAANTWLADTCAASNGRLLPVSALEYSSLDWAVEELARMRRRGSRIFLIPAYPVNGCRRSTRVGTRCGRSR